MELVEDVLSNKVVQADLVVYNTAISACSDPWLQGGTEVRLELGGHHMFMRRLVAHPGTCSYELIRRQ